MDINEQIFEAVVKEITNYKRELNKIEKEFEAKRELIRSNSKTLIESWFKKD